MAAERRGLRQETIEASLDPSYLFPLWEGKLPRLERRLEAATGINDLVDVIRSCNLRTKTSAVRQHENPHFSQFTEQWAELKYQAFLKAIRLRRIIQGIKVGYFLDDGLPNKYRERLIFLFNTQPKPYKSETALVNLTNLVPREELMVLLEPFDDVPRESSGRERKIFYVC